MTKAKELTREDPDFLPVQYDLEAAKLRKLAKEYDPKLMPKAREKGDDGYQVIHEKTMAITKVRTNIEKVRKSLNADALKWTGEVNTEAKRLTSIISELEAPWRDVKTELDEKEAREAEAARQREQERIEVIEQRIADIKILAEGLIGASAEVIKTRLDLATAIEIDEDRFDDYVEAAEHAKSVVVSALNAAYDVRVDFEEQQEQLRKQQAELAESQRRVDEENARLQKIKNIEAISVPGRIVAEQVETKPVEATPDPEPVTVDEKPAAKVVDLPDRTDQPTQASLSTSLKFWARDNNISEQAVRSLLEVLDRHGFEDLEYDDIA